MQHFKFLGMALLTNFKLSVSMRLVFALTIVLTILKQILFLIAWKFFFQKYRIVEGWGFDNMLFAYGSVCFGIGVVETFFIGLKDLPRFIETGQLDTYLLQPKSVILNIAMSRGDLSAIGEIITGIIVIAYSGYLTSALPQVILILILSSIFMFSLLLYLSCIAFFMKDADDFIRELNLNSIIVATQPNAAYRGALRILTYTLLPVAFLSFFPVEYLRTGTWYFLGLTILGTLLFWGVACWLFHYGLKRYESGNIIAFRQ